MAPERRRPVGPGFGAGGGTNVEAYIGLAERTNGAHRWADAGERIASIPVDRIDRSPFQVRVDFDDDRLGALAEDIDRNGLNQPVTLRSKPDGRYEVVAGERRWLAARRAGRDTIEARIRHLDDFEAHLVGVSENNQRADLSPYEKALEALELQRHAAASGRPHAQRDLASYLNRNVAIVNQQLAIAVAIPAELLAGASLDVRDACRLTHETLHRIARLPENRRASVLDDAARTGPRNRNAVAPEGQSTDDGPLGPPVAGDTSDRWTRLWETGGFQVHIRKPLREVEPSKASKYLEELLPGIGALALRAAGGTDGPAVVEWRHELGRLLFLRPADGLTAEQRLATRESLAGAIAELDAVP